MAPQAPAVETNMKERVLSYQDLGDIDHLYSRANAILGEARGQARSFNYDLAVRRAQEALELYIKTTFRFTETEYPKSHDLGKTTYKVSQLLAEYQVTKEEVARVVLANATLGVWRIPSFYGDERLGVARLFRQKEAEVAIAYAEEVRVVCEKVRYQLYQRATSAKR